MHPGNSCVEEADGTRVLVPDNLECITTYVLREQHDWFEDEIKFVRAILQPGDHVIDIGANYGVYTLSMAHKVGGSGTVYAFEPSSKTLEFLHASVALNAFNNIHIEPFAVSRCSGTAQFSMDTDSEINAIVKEVEGISITAETETVETISLDDAIDRFGWTEPSFLKVDGTNLQH